jgi:hypothetical protein
MSKMENNHYDHVIFFHMLKTGGNTVKTIIDKNYEPEEIFQITKKGYQTGPVDYFKSLPAEERNRIKLFRGHQHFGMHEYFDGNTVYFSFVREPISRLMSFYNHIHSLPNPYFRDLIPEEERSTFGKFVQNIDKYHDQGNNGQSRVIAGENLEQELLFAKAKSNIENHFVFVGLTERFDEAILLLKKSLNWNSIYYVKKKVSKKKVTKNTISEEELAIARELNKADIALYDYAKTNFEALVSENKHYIEKGLSSLEFQNKVYQQVYNVGSPVKQWLKKLGPQTK